MLLLLLLVMRWNNYFSSLSELSYPSVAARGFGWSVS